DALARLRARHRARSRNRPAAPRRGGGAGPGGARRRVRRLHRPAGEHARARTAVKFPGEFPPPDLEGGPTRAVRAGAARREPALARCDECGRYVWYPDGACRRCGASAHTWTRVSGRGRLFSWSVVHRAFIPQLAELVPFVTGLVAIDEDPAVRLATIVVDC